MLYTNLEILDMHFFRMAGMKQFLKASDGEEANFGIYRYRWGDAPLRAMLLGVFATASQVYQLNEFDYVHPSSSLHLNGKKKEVCSVFLFEPLQFIFLVLLCFFFFSLHFALYIAH